MKTPIIMCGDQAQFEIDHADTPPHERPDWPLPSFDGRDWALAFKKTFPDCGVDADTMVGWFANALMRGYDEGLRDAQAKSDETQS
jgi:inner membrane protein involved in colicin E2 resistance